MYSGEPIEEDLVRHCAEVVKFDCGIVVMVGEAQPKVAVAKQTIANLALAL